MFFSNNNTPTAESFDVDGWPMPRPTSPAGSVRSMASSTASRSNAPTPSRRGLFARFSQPQPASPNSPLTVGANNTELIKENCLLQEALDQAREQAQVNKAILHACVAQLHGREQECSELRQKLFSLEILLTKNDASNKAMKQELGEKDADIQALCTELQTAHGQISILQTESSRLERTSNDAHRKIRDLKERCQANRITLAGLRVNLREMEARNEQLQERYDEIAVRTAASNVAILDATVKRLEAENNALASRMALVLDVANCRREIVEKAQKQQKEHELTSESETHQGLLDQSEQTARMAGSVEDVEITSLKGNLIRLRFDPDDQIELIDEDDSVDIESDGNKEAIQFCFEDPVDIHMGTP